MSRLCPLVGTRGTALKAIDHLCRLVPSCLPNILTRERQPLATGAAAWLMQTRIQLRATLATCDPKALEARACQGKPQRLILFRNRDRHLRHDALSCQHLKDVQMLNGRRDQN